MAVTWKTDKFREMIGSVAYSTCVSIGDGFAERCAVLAIASSRISGKAVRFPLQPNGAVLLEQLKIMIQNLEDVVMDSRTGDLYLNTSTGGYRVIPVQQGEAVQAAGNEPAIPLPASNTRVSEKITIEASTNAGHPSNGIMQALASGIAYYGRSLGNRMSISSSAGKQAPAMSTVEKKPAVWTSVSSNVQDENNNSESIRVEITRSTTSRQL
jgi:hypothetical protein